MNPYPFVGLNHFTVPVAISVSSVERTQYGSGPKATRTAINRLLTMIPVDRPLDCDWHSGAVFDDLPLVLRSAYLRLGARPIRGKTKSPSLRPRSNFHRAATN